MAAPDAPIQIDMGDFKVLAKQIRNSNKALKVGLLRNLRSAGKVVQVEAKKNAAYSPGNIAPSIKVAVSGLNIYVQTKSSDASGSKTFIRALEEYAPGSWLHPVFGHGLVTQDAHPYLYPAVQNKADSVYLLVSDALEEALQGSLNSS